jgi:hypothetical protein
MKASRGTDHANCIRVRWSFGARWPWLLISLTLAMANAMAAGSRAPAGPRIARATRVERAPRLDGTLRDPIWNAATPITDFRQREPAEGEPATDSTSVRILYTRRSV